MGKVLIDKYEIVEKLGEGGSASVYMAYDLNLETFWAIKVLSTLKYDVDECYREANILKELRHPGLPRVIDVFEIEEKVYIVRDYIKGDNLGEYIAKNGPMDFEKSISIILKITDILNYLHTRERPVIYRDLKPDNIIYLSSGDVQLIDFGITRTYKEENDNDTLYMGTRGYAAPELYGVSQSDARTDVFALGVTIYYLYTGKLLYRVNEDLRWEKFKTDDDKIIRNIIEKCTRFDPKDRYQNVLEIEDYIKKYRKNFESSEGIRAKFSGKQYIGIMGYKKGVGSTHIALSIAYSLSKMGYRVNYIDQSDTGSIRALENYFEDEDLLNISRRDKFKENGIVFVKDEKITYLDALLQESDISIVDFGSSHYKTGEFLKLQHKIFVLPSNSWAYSQGNQIINEMNNTKNVSFMINMSSWEDYREIKSWLGLKPFKELMFMGYSPNPFVENKDVVNLLEKNFSSTQKKNLFEKIFNWRKK